MAHEAGEGGLTMAEYIGRETAIATIMSEPPDAHYPHWYADKIKAIPAADVALVRHGRWDIDEFGHYCTVCREYGPEIEGDAEIVDLLKYGTPYCPNCGAKMDKEG